MRKTVLIAAAMLLGAIAISSPNTAQARFGAEAIANATAAMSTAEPARYYRGYRRHPAYRAYPRHYGGYGAYAYSPYSPYSPGYNFWYNAPASIYTGSREALDTCALC